MARKVRAASPAEAASTPSAGAGGLALLDASGVVLYWSDALARLTGIPRADAVGVSIETVYPPGGSEDGPPALHLEDAVRHGAFMTAGTRRGAAGPLRAKATIVAQYDPDGTPRGFSYYVSPAPLPARAAAGEAPALDSIVEAPRETAVELAPRAEALRPRRRKIADSLATIHRALDLSPDGLIVTDTFGAVVYMNTIARRLIGLPDGELPNKPLAVFVERASRRAFRHLLHRVRHEARVEGAPLALRGHGGEATRVLATLALGQLDDSRAVLHWSLRPDHRGDRAASEVAARRELVQAVEEERVRISREIHDVLGQSLTALSLEVKAIEDRTRDADGAARIARVRALVSSVSEQAHHIAHALRPAGLEELGLERALRALAAEWGQGAGAVVDFHALGLDGRAPAVVEATLYRVAEEVLRNIARHAAATRVSMVLERTPWHVVMVVDDDGRGFDPALAARSARLGLRGARERVALIGGTFTVESAPGSGASVFVRVPIDVHQRAP